MENKTIYYPYYRVSTKKQGKTLLSLENQRDTCLKFIQNNNGIVGEEFQEVETASGKKRRPVLDLAVAKAKQNGVLLVSTLDRLLRDELFFFTLQKEGIKFQCVDNPNADSTTLSIFAVLAANELKKIKDRCNRSVATKKKRGQILGNPKILDFQEGATKKASQTNRNLAYEANKEVSDIICNLKSDFIKDEKGKFKNRTYLQVAERLNEIGKRKQNGGLWDAKSVEVLYKRYCTGDRK